MTWDTRYRQLEKDEIIEFADEYDAAPDGWRDPPRWTRVKALMIGTRAPDPQFIAHTTFRRRLPPETATLDYMSGGDAADSVREMYRDEQDA